MATPELEPKSLDRRVFCSICALTVTSLACGGGGAAPPPAVPPPDPVINTGQTKAGLALDTPMGFSLGAGCSGAGFFLVKDAGGVFALKALCTHQGGQPQVNGGTQAGTVFKCPCHGSEFDLTGGVTLGPAPRSLDHLRVAEVTPGGALTVDTSQVVAASVRI